jgi:predicted Zn-dependent protease
MREQMRRIERVGQRLLDTIPSHPKVQFVIVNGDPSINAGATFGQVAVTSGMLDFIESDDEMAVVLGHELAHITEGHVVKGTMGSLALNVLAIVLETQAPGAGQAAGGIGQLFLNHYTQTQERAADEVGIRYAYGAGYDPRAAVDVQERLAVQVPQSMSAGYFDTHPSSVERAVAAREQARELLAQGEPPGRSEALAIERSDQRLGQASRSRASPASSPAPFGASPAGRAAPADPAGAVDSEDCRRAAVYAEMARDARDPEERQQLERRAARFCPSPAGASSSSRREPAIRDTDEPLDRY